MTRTVQRRRRRLAGRLGPLLLLAAACGPGEPPNVLWVTIDTLRADRLSSYGYDRPTTPAIDRLAAEGVRFERAYATAPWTLPSVVSMLTGRLPSAHGVFRLHRVLPPGAASLPRTLERAGYATAAVVSNPLLGAKTGLDRHFERLDESEAGDLEHVSTPGVVAAARGMLEQLARDGRPFFLFAHFFDPHYRYHRHAGIGLAPERGDSITGAESYEALRDRADELSGGDRALLGGLYDEEVRFTDDGVDALVGALDALGLADRTLVVLTADHGEELLERGWFGHTVTLYDELVRVPLVVRGPGIAPRRTAAEPVSLVELGPAVLELVGLAPPGAEPTRLAALVRGEPAPRGAPIVCEVDYEDARERQPTTRKVALVRGDYKLIRDDLAGTVELYDLARDPLERVDLAARDAARARELAAALARELARSRRDAAGPLERELSAEELSELGDLGYVGDG